MSKVRLSEPDAEQVLIRVEAASINLRQPRPWLLLARERRMRIGTRRIFQLACHGRGCHQVEAPGTDHAVVRLIVPMAAP